MRVHIDRLTLELPGSVDDARGLALLVAQRLAAMRIEGAPDIAVLQTTLSATERESPRGLADRIAEQVAREIARAAAR